MRQTSFKTKGTKDDERISIALGTIRFIEDGFKRFGFDKLLNSFKESGTDLVLSMKILCMETLLGESSMNHWERKMAKNPLLKEFLCGTNEIHRWTLEKDLKRLGNYQEEVVMHILKVVRTLYPDDPSHVYSDGSHVKRYGGAGKNVKYGEGGGTVQLQDQFVVSSTIAHGLPIAIEMYPGNYNDPQQYGDSISQLMYLLKKGSLVVIDNGGSSDRILEEIASSGNQRLTRMRINSSDIKAIENGKDELVYVGMGTCCLMHTFESSGRTIYRYFSEDSYLAAMHHAEQKIAEKKLQQERARTVLGEKDPFKVISIERNPFFTVKIGDAELVETDDPWVEIDYDKELKNAIVPESGWFKLECTVPLDPRLALVIYRHRVDIEHLISCLKSLLRLSTMRVWSEEATRGKFVLALVLQFLIAVAVDELDRILKVRMVDGRKETVLSKTSPKSFVDDLKSLHGILPRYNWGGFEVEPLIGSHEADYIIPLLKKWHNLPPITFPDVKDWKTLPPAQWPRKEKNCKSLATPIAQYFENKIFPEYMLNRGHWKIEDPGSLRYTILQLRILKYPNGSPNVRRGTGYYGTPRRST